MVGTRPQTPEVSHGRGGAGNIAIDDTPYGDGEVVRAGPEGSHEDGAFSTGRGGKQLRLLLSRKFQRSVQVDRYKELGREPDFRFLSHHCYYRRPL